MILSRAQVITLKSLAQTTLDQASMLRLANALFLCTTILRIASADDADLKLLIGDRSLDSRDGLYFCELIIPENMPIEQVTLRLINRKGQKQGEMILGTTRVRERQALFSLSHEYIKNSKLLIDRSDTEMLTADAVLVIGDFPAKKTEGGKVVEVKIE